MAATVLGVLFTCVLSFVLFPRSAAVAALRSVSGALSGLHAAASLTLTSLEVEAEAEAEAGANVGGDGGGQRGSKAAARWWQRQQQGKGQQQQQRGHAVVRMTRAGDLAKLNAQFDDTLMEVYGSLHKFEDMVGGKVLLYSREAGGAEGVVLAGVGAWARWRLKQGWQAGTLGSVR